MARKFGNEESESSGASDTAATPARTIRSAVSYGGESFLTGQEEALYPKLRGDEATVAFLKAEGAIAGDWE